MTNINFPSNIANYLISHGVLQKSSIIKNNSHNKHITLNANASHDILNGYSLSLLLHRIGLKQNIKSSFSLSNMPSINKHSSASIVFIWNNLMLDLKQYPKIFNKQQKQTKMLAIAGDHKTIINIFIDIYNEFNTDSSPSLPSITDIEQKSSTNIKTDSYSIHSLPANNRFFRLFSESFSNHFFISITDTHAILCSCSHLYVLFNEYRFPADIKVDDEKYKQFYKKISIIYSDMDGNMGDLTWLQFCVRSNILSFMHNWKSEITKFIAKKSSLLSKHLSLQQMRGVKHEMLFLLQFFSFGLIFFENEDGAESDSSIIRLSVIFNAFSSIHAILRALQTMNNELLNDICLWMVDQKSSHMLLLICKVVLSLKPILVKYFTYQTLVQNKDRHDEKEKKIISHLGYEIWNVFSMISCCNEQITFRNLFDLYISDLFIKQELLSSPHQSDEYFTLIQCLFELLFVSLNTKHKNRTYFRHLNQIIDRLQNHSIIDFLINEISNHLSSKRNILHSTSAISALTSIWISISQTLTVGQKDGIRDLLHNYSRSTMVNDIQISSLKSLFQLLCVLSFAEDIEYAPKVYKMLIFSLMENHSEEELRDIMLLQFIQIVQLLVNIPVSIIIEPLVRQTTYYGCCQLHFELFEKIINHPRMDIVGNSLELQNANVKKAMFILHLVAKICVQNTKLHQSALKVLLLIVKKYYMKDVIPDYCEKYFKVVLSQFMKLAQEQHLSGIQNTPSLFDANFARMEISMRTLIGICKLQLISINSNLQKILDMVLPDYVQLFGHIHPLLKILYLQTNVETDDDNIDTARIHLAIGLTEKTDLNESFCVSLSPFKTNDKSFAKNNESVSFFVDIDDDSDESADTFASRICTAELETAVEHETDKYKRQLLANENSERSLDSILSSEMSGSLKGKNKQNSYRKKLKPLKKKIIPESIKELLHSKYRYILFSIFNKYLGLKPIPYKSQSMTFSEIEKTKNRLSLSEFFAIFDDYRVCNQKKSNSNALIFISRNKLKGILREVGERSGSMCTFVQFMQAIYSISQHALPVVDGNGSRDELCAEEKLLRLFSHMQMQHEIRSFLPKKLWSQHYRQSPVKNSLNYTRNKTVFVSDIKMNDKMEKVTQESEKAKNRKRTKLKKIERTSKKFHGNKKQKRHKYIEYQQMLKKKQSEIFVKKEHQRQQRMNKLKKKIEMENKMRRQKDEKIKEQKKLHSRQNLKLKKIQANKIKIEREERKSKIAEYKKKKKESMDAYESFKRAKNEKEIKNIRKMRNEVNKKLTIKRKAEIEKLQLKLKMKVEEELEKQMLMDKKNQKVLKTKNRKYGNIRSSIDIPSTVTKSGTKINKISNDFNKNKITNDKNVNDESKNEIKIESTDATVNVVGCDLEQIMNENESEDKSKQEKIENESENDISLLLEINSEENIAQVKEEEISSPEHLLKNEIEIKTKDVISSVAEQEMKAAEIESKIDPETEHEMEIEPETKFEAEEEMEEEVEIKADDEMQTEIETENNNIQIETEEEVRMEVENEIRAEVEIEVESDDKIQPEMNRIENETETEKKAEHMIGPNNEQEKWIIEKPASDSNSSDNASKETDIGDEHNADQIVGNEDANVTSDVKEIVNTVEVNEEIQIDNDLNVNNETESVTIKESVAIDEHITVQEAS